MPARKGTRPPGRKKGVPNKVTQSAREIFAAFLDHNAPKAQAWIDRVAVRNPAKALDVLVKLAEFFIPRLQRTELMGSNSHLPPPDIRISFANGGPGEPSRAIEHEAAGEIELLGEDDDMSTRTTASPHLENVNHESTHQLY